MSSSSRYSKIVEQFNPRTANVIDLIKDPWVNFHPEFILAKTMTKSQIGVVAKLLALRPVDIEWISLATGQVLVYARNALFVVEPRGRTQVLDFNTSVVFSIRKRTAVLSDPGIVLTIQISANKSETVRLDFCGDGAKHIRDLVLARLSPLTRTVVAVVGARGRGKSTLINALIGDDLAPTGSGAAVTTQPAMYESEDGLWGFLDTEGWTSKEGSDGATRLAELIESTLHNGPGCSVEAVWYCVASHVDKITPAEKEFMNAIQGIGIPVVFIVTQSSVNKDSEFEIWVSKNMKHVYGPAYVMAKNRHKEPSHGLEDLLATTKKAVGKK
jgi:GTP-binding protein EngB required for normal cell division